MEYIQIDIFNEYINIVNKDDGSGDVLIFDDINDVKNSLNENCQNGIIVPLNNSLELLEAINELLETGKLILRDDSKKDLLNFLELKNEIRNTIGAN